ncbi:MAG: glycine--tRNA ligase [Candidatus Xenobia bacterium]
MPRPTGTALMEKITALCKRRGFVFPHAEIYGGLNGFWDYGPLGTALKNNLRDWWWESMVLRPPVGPDGEELDIVGIDCAYISMPKIWEASGHVSNFTDPMVDCKACKGRFRADQLDETPCPLKPSKMAGQSDKCELTEARTFNLMFKTNVGALEDGSSIAYLRPETAQGMFYNFKNVLDTTRVKVPFGIAQLGKGFRNEITPRNFIFRSREFEMMEVEFFVPPDAADKWYQFWRKERYGWWCSLGLAGGNLRLRDHTYDELAHYAKDKGGCCDVEYAFPFSGEKGFTELEGIAYRSDYDLTQHIKHSGVKLEYFDPKTNQHYVPHVIEPAAGLTRGLLAVICEAYDVDESRPSPELMRFHPRLAPIKAGVFPLVNKDGLPEIGEKIYKEIRNHVGPAQFDEKQSIGKRYARMDEAGTPFCITVDGDTLKDQTVTVRERDTGQQVRVEQGQVVSYLKEKLAQPFRAVNA